MLRRIQQKLRSFCLSCSTFSAFPESLKVSSRYIYPKYLRLNNMLKSWKALPMKLKMQRKIIFKTKSITAKSFMYIFYFLFSTFFFIIIFQLVQFWISIESNYGFVIEYSTANKYKILQPQHSLIGVDKRGIIII